MANPADPPGPPEMQSPAALVASANRAEAESTKQAAFDFSSNLSVRVEAIAAEAEPPLSREILALIDLLDAIDLQSYSCPACERFAAAVKGGAA